MGKISDTLDRIELNKDEANADPQHRRDEPEKPFISIESSYEPLEKVDQSNGTVGSWDRRLLMAVNNSSKMVEVINTLRHAVLHPADGRKAPQSILVASATAKEGKSFIAANLGVSFAKSASQSCLLVDCNLRHPTIAHTFGIKQNYGLADYLRGNVDLAGIIAKTSVPELYIIPGGIVPQKHEELISSLRMNTLIDDITSRYKDHIIIIDSPSMLKATKFVALTGLADAVILVVRQGLAKKAEVQRFIDGIGATKILGIVFNNLSSNN